MSDNRLAYFYTYGAAEKLMLLLPCIRQKVRPRRNLLAGPYAGEFGYELMQWQGFVRARRPHYEQVHVLTYPGRDYMYEGCKVHYHDVDLRKAGYWYGLLPPNQARQMAHAKAEELGLTDYDIFETSLLCTHYHKQLFWPQHFRLFEEPPLTQKPYDVIFHFRSVEKEGPDQLKNYLPSLADELAARLLERGMSVACIGHPDFSLCAAGCADHRSVDLRQTVTAISSGRIVAGENSGPMHLANLCGRPTILWANDQWRINYSLRWNPFSVPIYVAANDTCQPAVGRVYERITAALDDLRARTDGFARPAYRLPPQQIVNY